MSVNDRYVARPVVCAARQFQDSAALPGLGPVAHNLIDWIKSEVGGDARYVAEGQRFSGVGVWAAGPVIAIVGDSGWLLARPGSYIVVDENGAIAVLTEPEFRRCWKRAS